MNPILIKGGISMAPSYVIFEEWVRYSPNLLKIGVFNYDDIPDIIVEKIKDGIITILPPTGSHINTFTEFVAGIFDAKSNFASVVCDRLKVPEEEFKGIEFEFNEIKLTVTKENADATKLYKEWLAKIKKLHPRKLWW